MVTDFLSTDHPLSEYQDLITSFRETTAVISGCSDTVWFDMFQLDCTDIKHGLCTVANKFANTLIQALAQKHLDDNTRYARVQCRSILGILKYKNQLCN